MSKIIRIVGREIIDSRGNPTVETEVYLNNDIMGLSSVPSGASVGSREALELRDSNNTRFLGKGVMQAVDAINGPIAKLLLGMNACNQSLIDQIMINCDGTYNKSKFGANAILSVSLAIAKAAACFKGIPLYEYISELYGTHRQFSMPLPMMNIINGGRHSNNNIDIQEFMIVPIGANNFKQAIQMGVEVFQNLGIILKNKDIPIFFGDEGGYASNLSSNLEALVLIQEAVDKSGYDFGKDIALAIDCASSELFDSSTSSYYLQCENRAYSSEEFIDYLTLLSEKYPILSIEDGLHESDLTGFVALTKRLGSKIQLVGDDLFVTNVEFLKEGINKNIANAILIKPNQIGSLTETLLAIKTAKQFGYNTIISHRSGETEDVFIADLSVGVSAGQIKTGSLRGSERIAKYNRLIRIEEYLGDNVIFNGLREIKIK